MTTLPPTTELFGQAQLAERHPSILNMSRVQWAVRNRDNNGLSDAVFETKGNELHSRASVSALVLGPFRPSAVLRISHKAYDGSGPSARIVAGGVEVRLFSVRHSQALSGERRGLGGLLKLPPLRYPKDG